MADLLECVIQIKAVADTPRRLTQRIVLLGGVDGARRALLTSVVGRLAAAEARFSSCLTLMLDTDAACLPALEPLEDGRADASPAELLETFGRRRAQVVRLLDACSAADLARVGFEPSRGAMSVADLVATILAHDTDQLAKLVCA